MANLTAKSTRAQLFEALEVAQKEQATLKTQLEALQVKKSSTIIPLSDLWEDCKARTRIHNKEFSAFVSDLYQLGRVTRQRSDALIAYLK